MKYIKGNKYLIFRYGVILPKYFVSLKHLEASIAILKMIKIYKKKYKLLYIFKYYLVIDTYYYWLINNTTSFFYATRVPNMSLLMPATHMCTHCKHFADSTFSRSSVCFTNPQEHKTIWEQCYFIYYE